MTLPFSPYQEIVDIAMRFAAGDGEFATDIGNLHISRRSKPSDPLHSSYRPCFAFVLQGAKSLRLGTELIS
ncbi:AraC family transcriptional regulator N-terminal domain-containing protein, partial [Rhizobium ruizarguesonis]